MKARIIALALTLIAGNALAVPIAVPEANPQTLSASNPLAGALQAGPGGSSYTPPNPNQPWAFSVTPPQPKQGPPPPKAGPPPKGGGITVSDGFGSREIGADGSFSWKPPSPSQPFGIQYTPGAQPPKGGRGG